MAQRNARHAEPRTSLELARWRQRKNLSIEEIADTTKISSRFLRAIEAEEFSELPGGIFMTSYLRQYAAAVGFEETKLLACYERKMGVDETVQPQPVQSGFRGLLDRLLRSPATSRSVQL